MRKRRTLRERGSPTKREAARHATYWPRMVTWKEFAASEPDPADIGRALLFQFGVGLAFLATVRRDGAPRLHPVCPVLSRDGLFGLITPGSPKRDDLVRDGRYAVQTFPQPKPAATRCTSPA